MSNSLSFVKSPFGTYLIKPDSPEAHLTHGEVAAAAESLGICISIYTSFPFNHTRVIWCPKEAGNGESWTLVTSDLASLSAEALAEFQRSFQELLYDRDFQVQIEFDSKRMHVKWEQKDHDNSFRV